MRKLDLHYRCGVGKHPIPEGPDFLRNALGQLLQSRAQNLVIITATRIDRHHGGCGVVMSALLGTPPVVSGSCVKCSITCVVMCGVICRIALCSGYPLFIYARQVIHSRANDAQGTWHQLGGPCTLAAVRRHIIHLPVETGGQPGLQLDFRVAEVDIGDAHFGKTELAPPITQ